MQINVQSLDYSMPIKEDFTIIIQKARRKLTTYVITPIIFKSIILVNKVLYNETGTTAKIATNIDFTKLRYKFIFYSP